MKSGRHRVGNGRNGSRPLHQSVDVDAMLFLSSGASHQTNGGNGNGVHVGGPVTNGERSHAQSDGSPGVDTRPDVGSAAAGVFPDDHGAWNGASGWAAEPNGPGRHSARFGPPRWQRLRRVEGRAVVLVRGRRQRITELQARIVLAALLVVVVAAAVGGATVARSVLAGSPKVIVTTAGPSTITNQPGGVGSLTEAPNNSFTVSLNLAGVQDAIFSVSQVDVVNGANVSAGTPLLQIDPTLLTQHAAQFQSQLASAQQSLTAAELTPQPKTSLGTTTQAQQTAALSEQVAYAQNLVAIAQGTTSIITAPTNGYVTGLTAQPGQVVGAGQPILQIVNPSLLDVSANLLLSDIQTVAPGDSAVVVPTGIPGVQLPGTVVAVSSVSSSGGLEGSVIIQCQNASTNPVPVGAQVFVHIKAVKSAAVSVPAVAVMNSDLAPGVFVLRHDRVYFRNVTIGATDTQKDEILTGLRAGEVVIESNMQSLTDGERVRVLGAR
jgi:membrane fusion protein, multidrug efflux system